MNYCLKIPGASAIFLRDTRLNLIHGYCNPNNRAYHNLAHIARMHIYAHELYTRVKSRNSFALDLPDFTWYGVAIWFHDYVYSPGAKNNEELSAQQARWCLESATRVGADISEKMIKFVEKLILATKHTGMESDVPSLIMVEADLTGLAAPWEEYEADGQAIRDEYKQYSAKEWRAGRTKFINSMLARDFIFALSPKLEKPARENMERELRELDKVE